MVERLRELAREAIRVRTTRATSREPSEQCKRLLAQLRKNCPGLIPPDPLRAGELGATTVGRSRRLRPSSLAAICPNHSDGTVDGPSTRTGTPPKPRGSIRRELDLGWPI